MLKKKAGNKQDKSQKAKDILTPPSFHPLNYHSPPPTTTNARQNPPEKYTNAR